MMRVAPYTNNSEQTAMKQSRLAAALCIITCLISLAAPSVLAQGRESGISLSQPSFATPSNFSIAKPGELTMQVNVWGQVTHPGRYEVSIQTDLVQLLSYAGGPSPDAKMASVKVTRFIKTDAGVSKSEYFVNLEDLYRVNDSSLILQPGDTIFIDQTSWSTLRDILTIVGGITVVAATVSTVIYNSHH
jgi:hypothetical protein